MRDGVRSGRRWRVCSRTAFIPFASLAALVTLSCSCMDDGPSGPGQDPTGPLAGVEFWAYQLQDQTEGGNMQLLGESHYDMLVIDQTRSLAGEEWYDSAGDVAYLHSTDGSQGDPKIVVCYIDVGEAEDYRYYWQQGWQVGDPEWIAGEDPDGWDGNYPVLFWYDEWQDIVAGYLDRIIEDGYDGIYLDWLEVYDFGPVDSAAAAQGLDAEEELISYVQWIEQYAHARDPGLVIVAQNASEMGTYSEYVAVFDAIAQEAIWFDGGGDPDTGDVLGDVPVDPDLTQEYLDCLADWQALGKPVFDVEYCEQPTNVEEAYSSGESEGYVTYCTLTPLDGLTQDPPPGY
ncbi:endo alpha-1,4 polygalactosaminidase [Candidatus Fermentibacterales bacterium]|nr:endo alpha-1,4 polygalactosaminidase [Candidatus Fermentibacterales bacterium]